MKISTSFYLLIGLSSLVFYSCKNKNETNTSSQFNNSVPHLNKADSIAIVAIYNKIGPWGNTWDLENINTWDGIGVALDTLNNEYRIISFNYNGTFHGFIPNSLRKLTELRKLGLAGGSLKGNIPHWIDELTKLEYLYIGYNQINGKIPSSIGRLPKLKQLILGNNQIDGNIPDELGNLINLEILTIMNTKISGEIPKSLSNLKNIKQLNLVKNRLSGEFPLEILKSSVVIDCSYNNIDYLPFDIWQRKNILIPDLQHNKLAGNIPQWVKQTENWKKFHYYIENQQEGYGYTKN